MCRLFESGQGHYLPNPFALCKFPLTSPSLEPNIFVDDLLRSFGVWGIFLFIISAPLDNVAP